MLEQLVWHDRPAGSECFHGLFEVDGIPEHDRGNDEVQATGTETLVIESPILDHSTAVEAHRAAQRVLGLALVQANGYAAAQLGTLQPVKREQRPVDAADLA